ncbi:MAG: peptidylprolyl isomerase [Bacteroidales bacterium]|nr:peptidylprolyl isomerase [Bacteroidales bacterium]
MKINTFRLILMVTLSGCILAGCGRFSGYQKSPEGLYYKFYRKNQGVAPKIGNIAQINLVYSIRDSVMFDSKRLKEPMNLIINKPDFRGDINQALLMMVPGDSASFMIRADSFFVHTMRYNRLPKMVKKGDYVKLEIGMVTYWTQEQQKKQEEAWKQARKSKEKQEIQEFINKMGFNADTTPEGLYFKITRSGTGPTPRKGDRITLKFSVNLLDGTKLFSSWDKNLPMTIEYGRKFDTEGINIALSKMNKGAVARLIIPSKLAFGEEGRPGFIPPYSALLYDVEVVDIKTPEDIKKEKELEKEEARKKEQQRIKEYLSKNNIQVQPTSSGLYFIELIKGSGKPPKTNNKVKVNYTGWLLDGTKFDSSYDKGQPFEFILGRGNVIAGWDEAVAMMKPGSKAKVIIPSKLGYGERGAQPNIPPFAPLVFEIELLSYE